MNAVTEQKLKDAARLYVKMQRMQNELTECYVELMQLVISHTGENPNVAIPKRKTTALHLRVIK